MTKKHIGKIEDARKDNWIDSEVIIDNIVAWENEEGKSFAKTFLQSKVHVLIWLTFANIKRLITRDKFELALEDKSFAYTDEVWGIVHIHSFSKWDDYIATKRRSLNYYVNFINDFYGTKVEFIEFINQWGRVRKMRKAKEEKDESTKNIITE